MLSRYGSYHLAIPDEFEELKLKSFSGTRWKFRGIKSSPRTIKSMKARLLDHITTYEPVETRHAFHKLNTFPLRIPSLFST